MSEWSAVQLNDEVNTARELNLDRIVSNQPQYNMMLRNIEKDVIPLSEREGIGQIVFSPLAQGVLTGKYKPGAELPKGSRAIDPGSNMWMDWLLKDEQLRKVEKLGEIAGDYNITKAQLALAWILRLDNISSCIIGASRPDQVDENIKASGVKISDADLEKIEEILS